MSAAETKSTSLSLDVLADLAEVLRQSEQGIVRDPKLVRRVTERSERVQEDLREKHGELNIAVDLIREIRDDMKAGSRPNQSLGGGGRTE